MSTTTKAPKRNLVAPVPTPPDPRDAVAVRTAVALWWVKAVNTIQQIRDYAKDIATEARKPESPLYGYTDPENWERLSGDLTDCPDFDCIVEIEKYETPPLGTKGKVQA